MTEPLRHMADDHCKCGHARAMHTRAITVTDGGTGPVFGKHGCCSTCNCDGFILDVDRPWLILARLAEVVVRSPSNVRLQRGSVEYGARHEWKVTVQTTDNLDVAAPSGTDERFETCELLANRWFERMRDAPGAVAPMGPCNVCNVETMQWCRPMHDGERAPGGWSHPGRGDRNSEVVQWARRIKQHGDLGNARLPDLDDIRGPMLERLVDEIIALAYINECMSVAAGVPARHPGAGDGMDFTGVDRGVASAPRQKPLAETIAERELRAKNMKIKPAVMPFMDPKVRR